MQLKIFAGLAALALAAPAVEALQNSVAHLSCSTGLNGTFAFTMLADYHTIVSANFTGLPRREKYSYFVNQYPVPADGDCSKTGGLFDPYGAYTNPRTYRCKPGAPAKCAIGDLTGRSGEVLKGNRMHGNAVVSDFDVISSDGPFYFRGRSVVLFNSHQRLVACGNIVAA
ncbi:Superoxide dismutase [Tieghemiomyces parasiticus]|uniref:Superoxide dismutase n=1 Tax=Tieghemiomyces parasiticus TaxID=78921 RepID=A0A9W7ZLS0_9FUNG|nr:Superoxide dismutase [Tieghemiomyces parasiticus]